MAEQLMNQPPPVRRPMKHAYIPQNLDQPSCIAYQPDVQGTFNLSPHILNTLNHFIGTHNEDPHLQIREFFALCKTQNIQGITLEGIRLILLPFSLKGNAKLWLNSLPANFIHTWEELSTKFLKKFFPAQETKATLKGDSNISIERWKPFL
jgi:hypothetical protein